MSLSSTPCEYQFYFLFAYMASKTQIPHSLIKQLQLFHKLWKAHFSSPVVKIVYFTSNSFSLWIRGVKWSLSTSHANGGCQSYGKKEKFSTKPPYFVGCSKLKQNQKKNLVHCIFTYREIYNKKLTFTSFLFTSNKTMCIYCALSWLSTEL